MKKNIEIKVLALGAIAVIILALVSTQQYKQKLKSLKYFETKTEEHLRAEIYKKHYFEITYGERLNIHVGDIIGDFMVKDLDISDYSYSVILEGDSVLKGKYFENEIYGDCFRVDKEDLGKIPSKLPDADGSFCFNNQFDSNIDYKFWPLYKKTNLYEQQISLLKKSVATSTISIHNYYISTRGKGYYSYTSLAGVSKETNSATETSLNATSKIKVGDKVGSFMVKEIYYNQSATSPYAHAEYPLFVKYDGQTIVRGVSFVDDMTGNSCFSVISGDAGKLPRINKNHPNDVFCFSNYGDIVAGGLKAGATTTILISDYHEDNRDEMNDGANFVKVISE